MIWKNGLIGVCLIGCMISRSVEGLYRWKTDNGEIYHKTATGNGKWEKTSLSGASWFGFETQDFLVNGLWVHPMDTYIKTLKNLGVNIIRVPFSAEWVVYNWNLYPYDQLISADPSLNGKTSLEILDMLFQKTATHGIGIMLDLHRLHKEYISELWYSPTDNQYTTDTFFTAWTTLLDYVLITKNHTNLVAIDLLNEPHGSTTWGSNDPSTDWRLFVQNAIPTLAEKYASLNPFLFFVEGIEWGHTFRFWNDLNAPLKLPDALMSRVVFSPHTYGKSVVSSTPTDYNILRQNWNSDFGFLRQLGYPVAVGEWGGITSLDSDWMNSLVKYLQTYNMTNQFFWSLGPNSGDVQGILLDDWTTVDEFKKGVMQQLVPSPTRFVF